MSTISHAGFPLSSTKTASAEASAVKPWVLLLGRIFYVAIFVMSGLTHFTAGPVAYAAAAGVPFPSLLVPASGILELAGGLSILLG